MVAPIRIVGGKTAASGAFRLELDPKAIARAHRTMERYAGGPLMTRMNQGALNAARLMVGPAKAAAPLGPTGNLRKSIRAGTGNKGTYTGGVRGISKSKSFSFARVMAFTPYGNAASAYLVPGARRAPHRHLVIRGHRIVTPGGRDTGRRSRPNDFIAVVARRHQAAAIREMHAYIFGTKGGA